jgi:predicted dehydrogenase
MSIRIAFAGTGYINKIHAQAARACGADLSAVVNHKAASRTEFARQFDIPRQYATVEELLKAGGLDALVVSTPNYLHAAQTVAALAAGVHVLVEKPISMNAPEAEQMWQAAQKSGAKLMVAHCWRFDPEAIWLRERIAAGRIGKVIRTKGCGVHVNWGPGGWFTQKRLAGGGAMADMGVHALDTVRFLLGDPQPVSVYARIGTYYGDYDVDDTGMVIVNWDNGAASYFESGWWQPHADAPNAGTQLYGQSGFASLFPTRVETRSADPQVIQMEEGGFVHPREPHASQSLYDTQMKYFLDCLNANRDPIPGGAQGWANMKVVDAAYESSRTGKAVDIH